MDKPLNEILPPQQLARRGFRIIKTGFDKYRFEFQSITGRAKSRFVGRDWRGMQRDAHDRLDLYPRIVFEVEAQIRALMGVNLKDKKIWMMMKEHYSKLFHDLEDFELAETFFNSITRRIFTTVGVDPMIEFAVAHAAVDQTSSVNDLYRTYYWVSGTQDLIGDILQNCAFDHQYEDFHRDIHLAAEKLEHHLTAAGVLAADCTFEILKPVFYRSKGAYLVGRINHASAFIPLIFSMRHSKNGIYVDALLLTGDEASIIFSFTRSYFHVETPHPRQMVEFLRTLMPLKRIAELYIAIGYNKHGKTELYRDLMSHLQASSDQFIEARGEKGMVMLVFTLPSYDLVFKVIRDHFGGPKTASRQDVMERYQLVFKHDRAGRLVDAQEFEHLRFEKKRFSPELLKTLLEGAPSSIRVEREYISISHLYTERRLAPLNLYLAEAPAAEAHQAVQDYGYAIKDLAATNIFPGDILLKNFGVTRHGRVVFYDYDELSLLTACRFRYIPKARSFSDDFESEPWFFVDKGDIFPEEFETFLGLQGELRDFFIQLHSDIFGVEFWRQMQKVIESGEVVDICPYHPQCRLQPERSDAGSD